MESVTIVTLFLWVENLVQFNKQVVFLPLIHVNDEIFKNSYICWIKTGV